MPQSSIFREYDIRGVFPATLDKDAAYAIGRAYAAACAEKGNAESGICVGYDGRLSSPDLKEALIAGIIAEGVPVIDIGVGPTPMLYFSVYRAKAAGGVMVTGSHNPPDHNGFKFMMGTKPFFGNDIQNLRTRIEAGAWGEAKQAAAMRQLEVREIYLAVLLESFLKRARGGRLLNVVWDAGNGAAGEIMAKLAAGLPGKHTILNDTIDGTFPVHHPDPTDPENLKQLQEEVLARKADCGIAFDGDGDRIGIVDDEGSILWGDQLLVLLAEDVLANRPGAPVIGDVKASQLLFDAVAALGGIPLMWKTGHSNIKSKMLETGAPLAGEVSGHIFFADDYFGYDDGLYAAVRVLAILSQRGEKLSQWCNKFPLYASTPEIRFPCPDERKFAVIEEVRARLAAESAKVSNVDGVRVTTPYGWWLLRASNTQAMLVARCEAMDELTLESLKEALKQQLELSNVRLPL